MQFSNNRITLREHARINLIQVIISVFRAHEHFLSIFNNFLHIPIITNVKKIITRIPASLFGYIYRNYVIFFFIKGIDCLKGGDYRNLMLNGATAEKNCYIRFHNANLLITQLLNKKIPMFLFQWKVYGWLAFT